MFLFCSRIAVSPSVLTKKNKNSPMYRTKGTTTVRHKTTKLKITIPLDTSCIALIGLSHSVASPTCNADNTVLQNANVIMIQPNRFRKKSL
jgi:hypothetical protein